METEKLLRHTSVLIGFEGSEFESQVFMQPGSTLIIMRVEDEENTTTSITGSAHVLSHYLGHAVIDWVVPSKNNLAVEILAKLALWAIQNDNVATKHGMSRDQTLLRCLKAGRSGDPLRCNATAFIGGGFLGSFDVPN